MPTTPNRRRFADRPVLPLADNFVRSSIAKPLLDLIAEDKDAESLLKKTFSDAQLRGRKAIFLDLSYPDGVDGAIEAVRSALRELNDQGILQAVPRVRLSSKTNVLLLKLTYDELDALRNLSYREGNPIERVWPRLWHVIIDVNLKYRPGLTPPNVNGRHPVIADPRKSAKNEIVNAIKASAKASIADGEVDTISLVQPQESSQYVFARLDYKMLLAVVRYDQTRAETEAEAESDQGNSLVSGPKKELSKVRKYLAIHQIWPDFEVRTCVHRSMRTVKADAAQNSFSAFGEGITWAILDTGIDVDHPHFRRYANIVQDEALSVDFTGSPSQPGRHPNTALQDPHGHGTHVAGIIAGQQVRSAARRASDSPNHVDLSSARGLAENDLYPESAKLIAASKEYQGVDDDGMVKTKPTYETLNAIAGIAPKCKLVSMRVLDQFGSGLASHILKALEHIQTINNYGRDLKIHGVNLSLGHGFNAEWFACGHSPLCVEVNRMVKSGVVVVVAAGNSGYGVINALGDTQELKGSLDMSINDPGNAELAITVGATHRDKPHRYGVSYFSSKGPTGDGRSKPDLLAPGERIVSAAAWGCTLAMDYIEDDGQDFAYMELSGTSQAAPHVSGAIAAFMSIRDEFIGEPERIKKIFTATATDVGRDRSFQGAGVLDLLRAIQSV
jgi:serine protease AprX